MVKLCTLMVCAIIILRNFLQVPVLYYISYLVRNLSLRFYAYGVRSTACAGKSFILSCIFFIRDSNTTKPCTYRVYLEKS